MDDYEWYDSDSGDIGVELGECEQGGVLELKLGARNSYTIGKGSSDVIQNLMCERLIVFILDTGEVPI